MIFREGSVLKGEDELTDRRGEHRLTDREGGLIFRDGEGGFTVALLLSSGWGERIIGEAGLDLAGTNFLFLVAAGSFLGESRLGAGLGLEPSAKRQGIC